MIAQILPDSDSVKHRQKGMRRIQPEFSVDKRNLPSALIFPGRLDHAKPIFVGNFFQALPVIAVVIEYSKQFG